jgi:hypothetical protein
MTVYIEKLEGTKRYNWRVKVGSGRGSRVLSRHYKKQQALQTGRVEARKRNATLKEQMQWGGWRTVRSYA